MGEKFANDVKKKTDHLDDMIRKKQMHEKDAEQKITQKAHKVKELRLLKAVLGRIKQYKSDNISKYANNVKKRIQDIKSIASNDAKKMMYKLIEQQKYSPYTECYDDKLFMFKDRKYTHGVCFHLFGISLGG